MAKESNILLLHSYAPDYPWTRQSHEAILAEFKKASHTIRYRVEYMDTKHVFTTGYLNRLKELYEIKYKDILFDGIIATDNNALNFLTHHRNSLFSGIPIVASGINSGRMEPKELSDIHIIPEVACHLKTLEEALRLQPDAEKIHIIVDNSSTGVALRQEIETALSVLGQVIPITFVPPMPLADLEAYVAKRSPKEILYLLAYFRDGAGQVLHHDTAPRRLSRVAPNPIYVAWDFQMNTGVLGGCLANAPSQGTMAAQTLLHLLDGGSVPPRHASPEELNHWFFDATAMTRFGIHTDQLPENAILLNRPQTLYETHKPIIQMAASIIFVLVAVIVLLLTNQIKQQTILWKDREIQALNREVIDTQRELVTTLGDTPASCSGQTADSNRAIFRIYRFIGEKKGFTEEEVELLQAVSALQDAGNIMAETALFQTPEEWTEEEFRNLRAQLAMEMPLSRSTEEDLRDTATTIRLQYHERWDGSGYPYGLKGEAIHLFARIICLVNVFDSLTSPRTYKEAWPQEKAVAFIRKEKGGMFDPDLVDLFLDHLPEINELQKEKTDTL